MSIKSRRGVPSFIAAELLLYLIFMTGDICGYPKSGTVTVLKFVSILLCNVFVLACATQYRKTDNYLLAGALLFTGISDYFLLFTEDFTFGMFTFCVVQILYLIRLQLLGKENSRGKRGIFGCLLTNVLLWAFVLFMLYKLKVPVDLLLTIAVFYFLSILHNVITAVKNAVYCPDRKNLVFAVGMILFLFCDINVGIYNMSGFVSVGNTVFRKLYDFAEIAMWMFYLPAQVFIAVSGKIRQNV
ncbi:lysoplasmalogenase family protein [Anaerocolumna xylanovorans]|uniref:YhhN-like protein n=1 Tax=Anaerocolumna xylanovorans DSM 12503 TaxID=1121345 RepID=A0A1M7YMC7_9FIRM|nr:lysoplasmalogenase family protein [Anaerocolumna xylanovorans]SHO53727.1 YhhN-like protein [Anaerocolumna xylanovorans DSM 12503]